MWTAAWRGMSFFPQTQVLKDLSNDVSWSMKLYNARLNELFGHRVCLAQDQPVFFL